MCFNFIFRTKFTGVEQKSAPVPVWGNFDILECREKVDASGPPRFNLDSPFFLGERLGERPGAIFKNDWQERINQYVHQYLKEHQKTMEALDRHDKEELVLALFKQGAFKAKHAAQYVANVLGVARATVYNYLRRINKDFKEE